MAAWGWGLGLPAEAQDPTLSPYHSSPRGLQVVLLTQKVIPGRRGTPLRYAPEQQEGAWFARAGLSESPPVTDEDLAFAPCVPNRCSP